MDRATAGAGEVADDPADVLQDRRLPRFDDGMDGVEPQTVEAIALQPVQRILDRECAHLRDAIVDGVPPWRMRRGEERRRIAVKVVTFGAEVIVDDVEQHHEPARVRFVDQGPQVIRAAIGAVGRVEQDAVVAPVAPAREVGDRHQLDRGDAGIDDVVEPLDRGPKRAARRERADVKLQDHRVLPWPATPCARAPFVAAVVDDLARPVHVLRLKMRGRIRHLDLAVDAVLVERAGAQARDRGLEPALRQRLQRMRAVEHELDALGRRRPKAEGYPVLMQLGAKAGAGGHVVPANASTERG